MISGILIQENGTSFILDENNERHFKDRVIWDGYFTHWSGQNVCARELEQYDYENNKPIIILWVDCQYFQPINLQE